MDDPVRDVESVIRGLTQTKPSVQRATVEKYFTIDAEFVHPFCRTGSFKDHGGSRNLIHAIYRWYKIMSPTVDLGVESIAYDASNLILYVTIQQVFRIWIIPFHSAPVRLTTVLKLHKGGAGQYLIKSQEDLYQFNEFTKFFAPGLHYLLGLWQLFSTFVCVLGAMVGWPVTYVEEHGIEGLRNPSSQGHEPGKSEGLVEQPKGSGNFITPPAIQKR